LSHHPFDVYFFGGQSLENETTKTKVLMTCEAIKRPENHPSKTNPNPIGSPLGACLERWEQNQSALVKINILVAGKN
jgi:hypothetical protein